MAIDSPGARTASETSNRQEAGGGADRRGFADQLRNKASDALSQQKTRATENLGSIVDAVRSTGRQLGDTNQPGIAKYVNDTANSLQRWVDTLEHKDVREIVEDIQQFGRQRPALFLGVTFGAGLLGARFLKSSARDSGRSYGDTSLSYGERDTMTYTAQRNTGTVQKTTYGSSSNLG